MLGLMLCKVETSMMLGNEKLASLQTLHLAACSMLRSMSDSRSTTCHGGSVQGVLSKAAGAMQARPGTELSSKTCRNAMAFLGAKGRRLSALGHQHSVSRQASTCHSRGML